MTNTAPRPTFAEVSLANDLRKLEEDYLLLEHRSRRPSALDIRGDIDRVALLAQFRMQCATARAQLVDGALSFEIVLVITRMLEACFHVARRAINGLDEPQQHYHVDQSQDWPPPAVIDPKAFYNVARAPKPLHTRDEQHEVPC